MVILPRFKMERELQLKDVLCKMGMKTAFEDRTANFQGMANFRRPDENLYLFAVVHKAFIEVDEKGTEAAAATAVEDRLLGASPLTLMHQPQVFRADHPFVFFIRDSRTGSILFMGRMADPRQQQ